MTPIRLTWFSGKQNFGDAISRDVVSNVSQRTVVSAPPLRTQLFAIGSILGGIAHLPKGRPESEFPYVWGTGSIDDRLDDAQVNGLARVKIAAVRGPLTAELVGQRDIALGDPGLLAADLVGPQQSSNKIGVILHYAHTVPAGLIWSLLRDDGVQMIDVTDPDHLEVVRQIGRCKHIISSSLHGLIVADSFSIPNTWLGSSNLAGTPSFKFKDYAGAIGRNLDAPLQLKDLRAFIEALTGDSEIPGYMSNIAKIKSDLRASFPSSLIAS